MDRRKFFKQLVRWVVLGAMAAVGGRVVRRAGAGATAGCGGCPVMDSCGLGPVVGDGRGCGKAGVLDWTERER